ncbi:hypothetical protein HanRHA438_Chr09g0414241 [Helianthus annuus]|nr:hypothetical protein HanIR_Chr09g0433551 [Helianthus annuus]KAJ0889563.1 hypothetical protein HanRHA438_Chr09g0414241 [Helianthus annuus]
MSVRSTDLKGRDTSMFSKCYNENFKSQTIIHKHILPKGSNNPLERSPGRMTIRADCHPNDRLSDRTTIRSNCCPTHLHSALTYGFPIVVIFSEWILCFTCFSILATHKWLEICDALLQGCIRWLNWWSNYILG